MIIKGAKRWPLLKGHEGLGDTMAAIARRTGLAKAAECVEKVTGRPCRCPQRQARLNGRVRYGE